MPAVEDGERVGTPRLSFGEPLRTGTVGRETFVSLILQTFRSAAQLGAVASGSGLRQVDPG